MTEPPGRATAEVGTLTRFDCRFVAPARWGPQVQGRDWKVLATLPCLRTPPESVHHRLLSEVFGPLGVDPPRAARGNRVLDAGPAAVRRRLSLLRDAKAMRESQAHGLATADRVRLPCELQFVCLASHAAEPVPLAFEALAGVWRR